MTIANIAEDKPEQQTEAQQIVRITPASIGFGMNARNWEEAFRIAKQLATSTLVPKAYQDHPEDIVVAMQMGAEIGLAPMQALQSIAVINGKPGVYGDGFLAVIKGSPICAAHAEWWEVGGDRKVRIAVEDLSKDDTTAVCAFWRKGHAEPYLNSFSIGEAKKAGLWQKGGNWASYPQRMLMWRARSWAGRDAFPDLLRGIGMAEELDDTPGDPITIDAVRPGLPSTPVRRSEKAAGVSSITPAAHAVGSGSEPVLSQPSTPPAAASAKRQERTPATLPLNKPSQFVPQATPQTTTNGVRITSTALVATRGTDPHWEIKAVLERDGQEPLAFIFVTEDEGLYKLAASCEDTDTLLAATWQAAKRQDKSLVKVLAGLEAAN